MKITITMPRQEFEVYPEDLKGKFNHEGATEACASLGEDWRLPTRKELLEMNDYKEELGLKGEKYWSSTEFPSTYAWMHDFSYGYSDGNFKSKMYRVRPLRTIK